MKTFEEFRFSIPHNKVKSQYKYFPKNKKELMEAIEAEIKLQGPEANLNCINTSEITDMAKLFNSYSHTYAKNFNGDISGWNVSNVKDMTFMFEYAKSFNQDISAWDVSNVTNMAGMFNNTESFNKDIRGWNVSNVENMNYMFYYAEKFNQDISNWNISNVKYYDYMFEDCPIKEEYKPKFKK